jgi:hypothetical protein
MVDNSTATMNGYTFSDGNYSHAYIQAGYYGNGIFTGNTSTQGKVVTSNSSVFNFNIFTFSAWVKTVGSNTSQAIISKKNTTNIGYEMYIASDATLRLNAYNLTDSFTSGSPTPLINNTWHYVTAQYNGTHINTFVNGSLQLSDASTGVIQNFDVPMHLARNSVAGSVFNGTIDEVRMWNVALNTTQIQQEMNSADPVNGVGLVASYSFESNLANASGNFTRDTNYLLAGQINKSLSFKDNVTYINSTYPVTSYLGYNQSSCIASWVKPLDISLDSSSANVITLAPRGLYLQQRFRFGTNLSYFSIRYDNGGARISETANGTYINKWSHLIACLENNGVDNKTSIYLNGVLQDSDIHNINITSTSNVLRIGATTTISKIFNGSIDDVRIYNRSLTQAEILTLYYGGLNSGKYNLFRVNTSDPYDNRSLSTAQVTIGGATYVTVDGSQGFAITNISATDATNVSMIVTSNDAGGYFSFPFVANVSNDYTSYIWQTEFRARPYDVYGNTFVTGGTLATTGQSGDYLRLPFGTYAINYTLAGFYTVTTSETLVPLQNTTKQFNMYSVAQYQSGTLCALQNNILTLILIFVIVLVGYFLITNVGFESAIYFLVLLLFVFILMSFMGTTTAFYCPNLAQ